MGQQYLRRLRLFFFLRISTSKWFDSKHLRPMIVRLSGIKLGKNCQIDANVTFDNWNASLFSIGDNCTIAMNSVLLTHNMTVDSNGKRQWYNGKLTIGNNVFVGAGVIITRPLTIGDNVVIAAGSVVTKDVPSNCVVAGSPCRVIKKFE